MLTGRAWRQVRGKHCLLPEPHACRQPAGRRGSRRSAKQRMRNDLFGPPEQRSLPPGPPTCTLHCRQSMLAPSPRQVLACQAGRPAAAAVAAQRDELVQKGAGGHAQLRPERQVDERDGQPQPCALPLAQHGAGWVRGSATADGWHSSDAGCRRHLRGRQQRREPLSSARPAAARTKQLSTLFRHRQASWPAQNPVLAPAWMWLRGSDGLGALLTIPNRDLKAMGSVSIPDKRAAARNSRLVPPRPLQRPCLHDGSADCMYSVSTERVHLNRSRALCSRLPPPRAVLRSSRRLLHPH